VLITTAPRSPDYEFVHRRRRYTAMMGLRIVCLLGAVFTYSISLWLALALVIGGAALPWCAVLLANDGPPRQRRVSLPPVARTQSTQLPGHNDARTVDADPFDGTIAG